MSKKKSKSNQSSNAAVNADSSDSNDVNDKTAASIACPHIAKSVDQTQVLKSLKNGEDLKKNFCPICIKESKPLKGNEVYVCLKCGTKTCCKEHSQSHFKTPRSDLHALAYDVISEIVWCYGCPCEINEKDVQVRRLSACVSTVNRQLSSAHKEKHVNLKIPDACDDNTDSAKDTNYKAPGFGKNGKKGGKMGLVVQSSLSLAPVRGLSNLGNTCYFNSVMQCLARTKSLLSELKEMENETDIRIELKGGETLKGRLSKWDQMPECLYKTLSSLLVPGSTYVPLEFLNFVRKKHPQFEGNDQHDAHELLRHTLDSIKMNDLKRYHRIMLEQKGLLKADPKAVPQEVHKQMKELEHKVTQVQTFIPEKTFKGRLVSRVECQECHHSSEYIEGFLDLSLPVLADKPHPPAGRRKGNSSDELPVDSNEPLIGSKVMSKKAMRQLKKRERKAANEFPARGDEIRAEADEAYVEKEEGPRVLDEEKPHESGYSSEKASSSLRGSPSSEEVRSSSPCDDSWSNLPQITDSWLSSLPDGALPPMAPAYRLKSLDRPSGITFHPNGSPDISRLSLYDSMGSTLNQLCMDTQSIINQQPDWRSHIKQEPSKLIRFSSSFESGNSEESKQIDDTDGVIGKLCLGDSNEPLVAPTAPGKAELPTSQIAEGLSKLSLSEHGRSLSPPLRKTWVPVKRDPDFSPLKEEECDTCVAEVPFEEDAAKEDTIKCDLDHTDAPKEDTPGCEKNSIVSDGCSTAVAARDDSKEVDRFNSEEKNTEDSAVFDTWSSIRESLNSAKDAAVGALRCDGERNFQSVHHNSLDSNGNETEDESFPTMSGELPIGDFVYEDSPVDSPVNHSLPLPPPDPLSYAEVPDPLENSHSSMKGDFEPLLGDLCETPRIPSVAVEDAKKEEPIDSTKSLSKIPCPIKKKDNRDSREMYDCSIESCLRQFTSIEFMTGNNKVGCSACTERQNKGAKDGKTVLTMATKQLLIGQAPPVLILHLKRFQVQLHSVRKLTKHVSFPLTLNLGPFCTSIGEDKNKLSDDFPMLYSLYGIVEHRGTLHSGHYVAYVKVEETDKRRWFCISDFHIDEVTEERVLKTEAYLLFYSKITIPSQA